MFLFLSFYDFCTMLVRRICYYMRPFVPMIIGLCLGIGLSLILAPFVDENCDVYSSILADDTAASSSSDHLGRKRELESVPDAEKTNFDYFNSDDFEPRLKRQAKPKSPPVKKSRPRKILRPRYASTELGIREKLFVAVLTSKATLDTMGIAMNKTLSHYVNKILFFMDTRGTTLPGGMSIVSFTDNRADLKPFHMIKYIGDHYRNSYDWFFIVPDHTYVHGEKLLDFVNDISISKKLHMGVPSTKKDASYCSVDAGIILSQEVLSSVFENNKWCSQNAFSPDTEDNIGRCIYQSTGLACSNTVSGKTYSHYTTEDSRDFDVDNLPPRAAKFNTALTVGPLKRTTDLYKMHRYFCEVELRHTEQELEKTKDSIINMSVQTPGGRQSATWPIGVQEQFKPKSRFDVIRWDYFTENHIYLNNDFTTIQTLKGVDKKDITDILETSLDRLNKKYSHVFTDQKLTNGYRRFDPIRGMEYILDLSLRHQTTSEYTTKRVHLVRPLSQVEIVPMPYVTENSRVNLILPVTRADRDSVVSFLDSYAHTCLNSGDNTNLVIVFIYEMNETKEDVFSVLKSMSTYYGNKYQNGARISWTSLKTNQPSQLVVMDTVSKQFKADELLLYCTVGIELSIDFLNRVRMNTIDKWQVFFPMGFHQYKPNLIYDEKPYPANIELKKNVGHYGSYFYEQASFYCGDYTRARSEMMTSNGPVDDMLDLFVKQSKLHVFRAIEPALKHRYHDQICDPMLSEDAYQRCLLGRSHGLASQSQLAMLIFEQQKNVDSLHLEVLHQQKDPNIDQMKVK